MNVEWNEPESIPCVAKGGQQLFWIAVDSQHTGETHVFLAYFQNRPLELDKEGEPSDDTLHDPDGEPINSVGWVDCKQHHDFDDFYTPLLFDESYKLLGWAEYEPPKFTGLRA